MNQSHVIIIVADQLRYDVLGKGYTPNIDSLSKESTCFSNAYCNSPLCVPARGSLFTGLCPNSTGSLINPWEEQDAEFGYVKEGIDNLYQLMEGNGYECIHSGKQHFFTANGKLENQSDTKTKWLTTEKTYKEFLNKHNKRMPGGKNFRSPVAEMLGRNHSFFSTCSNANTGCYEEGESYYFDRYFTSELLNGLKKRDKTKPLFLSAMFLAPHPPLDIPEPWYLKYNTDDFVLPDNVGNWYPHQSPLQLFNITGMLGAHYSIEEWKESWRAYLGLVSLLDDCVGQVINELKKQEIYDNSIIIFTSDHGEMLGSHRLFQKMCMYQESVKVPLYIHFPSQKDGIEVKTNVSHIDILPTLCHYLSITTTHIMEGTSLCDIHSEKENSTEHPVFIQYDGNGSLASYQRCVILGKYKLILDVFKEESFYELYDILSDPQEKSNLYFEQCDRKIFYSIYALLQQHLIDTGDKWISNI